MLYPEANKPNPEFRTLDQTQPTSSEVVVRALSFYLAIMDLISLGRPSHQVVDRSIRPPIPTRCALAGNTLTAKNVTTSVNDYATSTYIRYQVYTFLVAGYDVDFSDFPMFIPHIIVNEAGETGAKVSASILIKSGGPSWSISSHNKA